jgi:hypothetical protein
LKIIGLAMGIYDKAAWSVIFSLALILVGGLVLWAYGARQRAAGVLKLTGPEAEAAQRFHAQLARWFFLYGVGVIAVGIALLLWAASIFY